MKLTAKIQYRKNIPTTAAGCVSDPHGGANQNNTPGLSFEGIGRELRWNNWNSNNTAAGSQGSQDGLSLANMLAGDEFSPNETIKTQYGPYYPAPGSNQASDFLGYDHWDPPPWTQPAPVLPAFDPGLPDPPPEPDPPTPTGNTGNIGAAVVGVQPVSPPPVVNPPPTPAKTGGTLQWGSWSDSRVKTQIKHVGKSPSGINIYEFNYIFDGTKRYRGVLGNELEKSHPEAVGKKNGLLTVNYTKIDVNFEEVK